MDRRGFLRSTATAAGATAAFALLPDSLREALAAPAPTGGLDVIEHVVVLMQENRSFDHYYGTLRGVRGFNDPTAIKQYGSGKSIFEQPNLHSSGVTQSPPTILPFHPTAANLGQQFLTGLPHA